MFGSNPIHMYLTFTYVSINDISPKTLYDSFQTPALFPLHLMPPRAAFAATSITVQFGFEEGHLFHPLDAVKSLLLNHLQSLEIKYSTLKILSASLYEYDALDQMPGETYRLI